MREIKKPWGREVWFAETEKYVGKIIEIESGKRLSLQYHKVKDETIYVLEGKAKVTIDKNELILSPGEFLRIKPRQIHRIEAKKYTKIIEVSTPETDDVVRLEDDYGRV